MREGYNHQVKRQLRWQSGSGARLCDARRRGRAQRDIMAVGGVRAGRPTGGSGGLENYAVPLLGMVLMIWLVSRFGPVVAQRISRLLVGVEPELDFGNKGKLKGKGKRPAKAARKIPKSEIAVYKKGDPVSFTDPKACGIIRLAETGIASVPATTLCKMFKVAAANSPTKPMPGVISALATAVALP